MEYIIHGENMTARRPAHEEIASAMRFPEYYGYNLDALYDMLTQTKGHARLVNVGKMLSHLEGYGVSILKAFYDAVEANPNFTFSAE